VYGRSSEQTASVFSFGATLVGFTGAYPYDGREAVHSTALTKSAADFNWSRRPSPFLVDDGLLFHNQIREELPTIQKLAGSAERSNAWSVAEGVHSVPPNAPDCRRMEASAVLSFPS
jgi:hypothetical protein